MSELLSIGIDLGGTFVKIGVCHGSEIVHIAEPIVTQDFPEAHLLIGEISRVAIELAQSYPKIAAIGSGVPGLVDFERGLIHVLTNVPGWTDVFFRDLLQEKTGLPAVVDNDANCMAYAEWRYGAGEPFRNVVALTLGTGVGGGLILENKLFRGSQFAAGEIGQMSIDYKGRPGPYGNTGAAEVYIGNRQIAEHAVMRYAERGITKFLEECTPKLLSELAANGCEIALEVWKDVADWLGTGLASVAWLLNPEVFIIGGGVANAGSLIFDPLSQRVESMVSEVLWKKLKILPAKFGNEAGIIGSAAQALDSLTP